MTGRRFGIVDLMLLVAAVAVGLWVNRLYLDGKPMYWDSWRGGEMIHDRCYEAVELALPHLAAGSVALFTMHLQRPPFRRAMRRPGAVACVAACVAMASVAGLLVAASIEIRYLGNIKSQYMADRLNHLGMAMIRMYIADIGFIVIGAWIALSVTCRWRPEPTWIDRLGRALGFLWIAIPVCHRVVPFLP